MLNEMRQYQPEGDRLGPASDWSSGGSRSGLSPMRRSLATEPVRSAISSGESVAQETGMAAVASENPHNQTFGVAIQLGLAGAVVLFAMWIAHLSFVPWRRICRVGWTRHCDPEYRRLAVQLPPVRFHPRLELRRRCRGGGGSCFQGQGFGAPMRTSKRRGRQRGARRERGEACPRVDRGLPSGL